MSKPLIIGSSVLAAFIIAGLAYYFLVPDKKTEEKPVLETGGSVNVPDVNPVSNTNPFSDIKTNPFE